MPLGIGSLWPARAKGRPGRHFSGRSPVADTARQPPNDPGDHSRPFRGPAVRGLWRRWGRVRRKFFGGVLRARALHSPSMKRHRNVVISALSREPCRDVFPRCPVTNRRLWRLCLNDRRIGLQCPQRRWRRNRTDINLIRDSTRTGPVGIVRKCDKERGSIWSGAKQSFRGANAISLPVRSLVSRLRWSS